MHLKMFVLSASAVALWLAPLSALDKKVSWHKAVQGVSLCAGIACAMKAGSIARKLSEQGEIEVIKERAITADVMDEISTSVYVSQQQRQQEAEQILNGSERSEEVERLERALALTCSDSEPTERSEQSQLTEAELELAERIMQLKARGYGKAKIILELWGVSKGGSPKYKAAEAEYKRLVGEG
ncbi:hypothetical protein QUB63_02305 [Microcoleus sp. ARI1-B5]|uniref:hypothetical protein n=1 Tax=unclassified Microcoleus TaxID=2642155 RepID=UPI002FD5C95F